MRPNFLISAIKSMAYYRPLEEISMAARRNIRRGGGVRRAGSVAGKVLGPALRRQGFAQSEIISRWPEIVGAVLAACSVPERLAFPDRTNAEGTLHIRVDGAFAIELQHLEPLVIEKINRFYGYRAVARLRITQGPLPRRRGSARAAPRPLGEDEEREIAEVVAGTRNSDLKQALVALGRAVTASESGREGD